MLNTTEYDAHFSLNQLHLVSMGAIPLIYSRMYSTHKLSIQEYSIVRYLWNKKDFTIRCSVEHIIHKFYDVNKITKSERNSLYYTLNKLTKYGIIQYSKPDFRGISVSLSIKLFNKLYWYLMRHYEIVSAYQLIYLRDICDKDFMSQYELVCKETGVEMASIHDSVDIIRSPIVGLRCPVVDLREPIVGIRRAILSNPNHNNKKNIRKLNFNAKKYDGLSESEKAQLQRYAQFGMSYVDQKLKQMRKSSKIANTTQMEMDCIDNFVPYYENLICKTTGKMTYSLLPDSRNKKSNRLWTPIFKTYMLCVENDWDWKIYLESQFEAFKEWKRGNISYPMPNMLYSERAIKAYENYVYHHETAYNNEGWETKLASKEIGTFQEELRKTLNSDKTVIDNVIKYSLKKSFNKTFKNVDKTRSDIDSLYYSKAIQQSWEDLSFEFWSVIPQMSEFLDRMYGQFDSWDAKIDLFRDLLSNQMKYSVVKEVYNEMKLPKIYGIIEIDSMLN